MTKLTEIETLGVALVTRGANRQRLGVKKADEGDDAMSTTVAQKIAQVITKGDLPIDDAAFAAKAKEAGLTDPQEIEVAKALVKLAASYKDSGAFEKFVTSVMPEILGMKGDGGTQVAPDPAAGDKGPPKDLPSGGNKPPPEQQQRDYAGQQDPGKKEPPMSTQKDDNQAGADKGAGDGATTTVVKTAEQLKVEQLETLVKSQQDSFKDTLAKMQKSMDDAADAQLLKDWVAKARDDLKFVPGKSAQELGQMLFDTEKKVSKESAETQFSVLKSSSTALEKSAMFRPSGFGSPGLPNGGTSGNDAAARIAKSADAILEKSDVMKSVERLPGVEGMTPIAKAEVIRATAVVKAMEMNPELYADYLREHQVQSGNRYQN